MATKPEVSINTYQDFNSSDLPHLEAALLEAIASCTSGKRSDGKEGFSFQASPELVNEILSKSGEVYGPEMGGWANTTIATAVSSTFITTFGFLNALAPGLRDSIFDRLKEMATQAESKRGAESTSQDATPLAQGTPLSGPGGGAKTPEADKNPPVGDTQGSQWEDDGKVLSAP